MKPLDKENFHKNILYVDNHILVVIKEANIPTQKSDNISNNFSLSSLEDLAKEFIKQKFNKKAKVFLHPIHRLDKNVTGIVIFARTSKALSRLNEQMREKKIIRKYLAEVEGKLSQKKARLTDYIVHLSHRAKIVKKEHKNAKLAILNYEVIKEKRDSSIVEIELITGRYHQIRAQFSNLGHPIVGDRKYLAKKDLNKIHLSCFYIEFSHPVSKKVMEFQIKPSF
ncbi:MAG: Ribosomal large subunit pseudouridine synthase C [Candidatus Anoxychlamydiales bacterium]|nr:Ribosomal large subunit pseudouridine synthase C [Candidatus Anoxychlamydiales bacterium]